LAEENRFSYNVLRVVTDHKCRAAEGVSSMLDLEKAKGSAEQPAKKTREHISAFLARELPPQRIDQAEYLTEALLAAGARYDRYHARARDCMNYSLRRTRLNRVTKLADELAQSLRDLDILTHDELASRIDEKVNEALIGSLLRLSKETNELTKDTQKIGKARDLAEECWMFEVADIYENAFGRAARVSGSGDGDPKQRGSFYRLLELCRPSSYARHGKLSVRQVDRVLKRRKKFASGLEIGQNPSCIHD
jgi:hypothetical protein